MAERIEFSKGERLAASKLQMLADSTARNRIGGTAQRSSTGSMPVKMRDADIIEQYRPFDVLRETNESIIVRGGLWEYYDGITRTAVKLAVDSGTSSSPDDFKTITPSLSASTAYSVYLELDTSADTLTANVVATSSFPSDAANKYRVLLTEFTTDADSNIPDFDIKRGDILSMNQYSPDFDTTTPSDVASSGSAGSGTKVSHSNHIHRAPHWNEMQDAESDTAISPDSDDTYSLEIGESLPAKRWSSIIAKSNGNITLYGYGTSASDIVSMVAGAGAAGLYISGDGYISLSTLPTSASGLGSGTLYTQTAAQLGGSGSQKVICIV